MNVVPLYFTFLRESRVRGFIDYSCLGNAQGGEASGGGGVGGEVAQVVPAELEEGVAHGGGAAGSGCGEAVGMVFMMPGRCPTGWPRCGSPRRPKRTSCR